MKYYKKDRDVIASDTPIEGYSEITEAQYNEFQQTCAQIARLLFELKCTDYKCLKHMDGELTDEEYAPIKEQRHNLRIQINELQESLDN